MNSDADLSKKIIALARQLKVQNPYKPMNECMLMAIKKVEEDKKRDSKNNNPE